MKYIFLILAFLFCISSSINAQTLTDITICSDKMESIKTTGFNWATSPITFSLGQYKIGPTGCPIRHPNGNEGEGDEYEYGFTAVWYHLLALIGNSAGSANSGDGVPTSGGSNSTFYTINVNGLPGSL